MQTDTFQDLFEDMADVVGVMTETLVLTHDGKRVFPASTPQAFGVWSEATLGMYVFPSSTRLSHLINTTSIRPHVLHASGIRRSIIRVDHLGCCSHDWRHGRLQTIEFAAYRQSDCPFGCIVLLVRHFLIIIALQLI